MVDDANAMSGEEIVISGMSGMFPNSSNVQDFMENLYNKVDMVGDKPRWSVDDPEIPKYSGKVPDIDKFDAQFFKVGYEQAKVLEPMSKKLLEHAYGAIFDSGNTHATLKDKVVGVFMATSFADYCSKSMHDVTKYSAFIVGGSSKAMFANRISYWMDGRGPSYTLDYSCTSSCAALELAFKSMKAGDCDAAVVGGSNLCSLPSLSLNMKRAGLLCMDGKTKCFDKNGDGYVRSDAISLIFLQKAKDAKRVYAEVYHAQGAYQLKLQDPFLPLRKPEDLEKFLKDVYSKTDIDPKDVEYVEAHGAGLAEADNNEVEAISNIFGIDKAMKLGSVKSNMGHSEPASGLCAITKLCLAYHKGEIPANLHYNEPVAAIKNGKIQVVTENTKFDRGYTALNNLSLTGGNFHVVMKGHYKRKQLEKYNSEIPRIVLASGRQENCVNKIFDVLKCKPIDAEEIALLHNIFASDVVGHTGRGYAILDVNEGKTVTLSQSVDYFPGVKPPLWFVYSGMGSQWAGMGADLMRIPTFAAAIQRCHKVLEPKGIDIVKVITDLDNKIFDNGLHSFVGIGAVQIGLTDILKEMGVVPDYIIGHSLGEMACAYHDDTFTTEELMLSTLSRGIAIQESVTVKGAMAAVGVGYKTLVNQCPPDIDIACHNSSESSTISGPEKEMKEFVEELTGRGIFARTVPSGNVAYHSRYVAEAGPALRKRLREILKNPKLRSERWISSSVPSDQWDQPDAKYSSPEYHTNNLLNPVLFEEMTSLIPSNAVVVEIAPHSLLQAILKRSHKECTHVPLTKRGTKDGVKYLLDAVGKLYEAGFNPKVDILYPKVDFPVSTETPLLSHLVEWEHSEDWPELSFITEEKITSSSRSMIISLDDDDHKYLTGYVRNGVNVLPETALLVYVWETLAMYQGIDFRHLSVVFKDIHFHSEIILTSKPLRLTVMISKGNETFEVTEDDKLIVSGVVSGVKNLKFNHTIKNFNDQENEFEPDVKLTSQDIYKYMAMRGFTYKGMFQSIISANLDRSKALVKWSDNWIPFLDSLIQLNTISMESNGLTRPKFIRKLKINVLGNESADFAAYGFNESQCHKTFGILKLKGNELSSGDEMCTNVEIEDITYTDIIPIKERTVDVLESCSFFPYYSTEQVNIEAAFEMNLQIISENSTSRNLIITKVISSASKELDFVERVGNNAILLNVEIKTVNGVESIPLAREHEDIEKTNVILMENLLQSEKNMKSVRDKFKESFIISLEDKVPVLQTELRETFSIISCMSDGKKISVLMKRLCRKETFYMPIRFDDTFSWVPDVFHNISTTKRVVLISERQPYCGLLGLVKKLKADGHDNISIVVIDDFHAPKFDPENVLYKEQMLKNLTINVMKKGQWGGYYSIPSKKSECVRNFTLKNLVPGDLNELQWVESPKVPGDKILVQVCYSGLSIKDCHKIVDENKKEDGFGMDFSGIDRNGDRVMGLISGGSLSSTIEVDPDLLWPVPDHWTLEDAATVPLAYVQAYYCMTISQSFRSRLLKGKTVFISDNAGNVGHALISLYLSLNCIVFVAVDSRQEKNTLMQFYPQLNESNVIITKGESFHDIIMINTNKQGCDFVINFGTGAIREAASKCVAECGQFFDFSKYDMNENKSVGMSFLQKERSYLAVDVSYLFRPEYCTNRKLIQDSIARGIKSGIVKPLVRVYFSPLEVTRAFRILTLNQTTKILVRVKDPSIMSGGLKTTPRLSYFPQDVLIIICDEKGIGIELVDFLIKRGAKKLILHMKTVSVSGYIRIKFLTWAKQEVSIKLSSDNLQTERGCGLLMKNAMKFGKVKGVFVVFDPKQTDNRTKEDFINAYKKQCVVVTNLDVVSRNCADLMHFVILSRLSQSASDEYALSLTERVCDIRNEMGLPTLVVRCESLVELDDYQPKDKILPQSISELFNVIETSLKLKYKNVVTFNKRNEIKTDFENKIAEILGVNKLNELRETTLSKIMNEVKLKALKIAVKKCYHVDIPLEKLSQMTIKSLKHISEINKHQAPDFGRGMSTFFRKVASEEDHVTAETIVELPTLLRNNGVNQSSSFITMIPGFEGSPEVFTSVAERLKIPAVCVQLGPDTVTKSVHDIAVHIRKEMKTRFETASKFYLLGYSFGVNIALELARIFENEGVTGVVYCLESSPDALRIQLDAYLGTLSTEQLQNCVLSHICDLITGAQDNKLKEDLEKIDCYETKIETCLKALKQVKYSVQYKRNVLESAYRRIIIAKEYQPKLKLQSEIVLMKSNPHPKAENLAEDYGLSKYSDRIKVFNIESDHATIPYNPEISNIVNSFLDKKVLEEFKSMNLCDVYLASVQ